MDALKDTVLKEMKDEEWFTFKLAKTFNNWIKNGEAPSYIS